MKEKKKNDNPVSAEAEMKRVFPVVAWLLPGYSPGLEWLARAQNADLAIMDDAHPFSRKSRVHRTKIRTPGGYQWLSLPFLKEDRNKPIRNVRIDKTRPWLKHHWQALELNYRNSLYFDYYEPEIRHDFETVSQYEHLAEIVGYLMKRQWAYLQLDGFPMWVDEIQQEKQINVIQGLSIQKKEKLRMLLKEKQSEEGVVSPFHAIQGEAIIWQEPDSHNYQRPHRDASNPVFPDPRYRQHFPGFVSGCGLFDLLFEYGPDAWQVLDRLTLRNCDEREEPG